MSDEQADDVHHAVRRPVHLVFPGCGGDIDIVLAALREGEVMFDIVGLAGASGGGVCATFGAFGVEPPQAISETARLLGGNRMLDVGVPDGRAGICDWNEIRLACDRVLGSKATLGDAILPLVVGATCIDSQRPAYFSKRTHPRMLVRDVLPAMCAFPGVAKVQTIPSLGSPMSPDRRLWSDLGLTDNCPDHVFDDEVAPRIAVRLRRVGPQPRIELWDYLGQAKAIAMSLLYAPSARRSVRTDGLDITLEVEAGGSLNFDKTPAEVRSRYEKARRAFRSAVKGWLPPAHAV